MMKLFRLGLASMLLVHTASGAKQCILTDPIAVDRAGEVTLQQLVNDEEGTLTLKMTYTGGRAWVSVGINDDGKAQMTPATVVIGWGSPDGSPTVPMIYGLSSKAPDASGVVPTQTQNLQNATFEQTDTTSTLTFTQRIQDFGTGNAVSDDSQWIFAIGSPENTFNLHPIVGSFKLSLASTCFDDEVEDGAQETAAAGSGIVVEAIQHPERALWMAHGILLATAWGICAPIAIGASLLRGAIDGCGLPKGTWFKIHFFMNVLTVWMTIAGFIIAVVATNKEEGTVHFAGAHHKIGLIVFVLAFLQAAGGKLRPGLPHAPAAPSKGLETTNHTHADSKDNSGNGSDSEEGQPVESSEDDHGEANEEQPKKSALRVAWEWGHRIVGLALLGMAWANCHTGIDWFLFNWQDEASESLTAIFWGVAGGISGIIAVLSIISRIASK